VERLVGKQHQDGRADVAAPNPGAALSAPAALPAPAARSIVRAAALVVVTPTFAPLPMRPGVRRPVVSAAPAVSGKAGAGPPLLWIAHASLAHHPWIARTALTHHSWTFHHSAPFARSIRAIVLSSIYLDISMIERHIRFVKGFSSRLPDLLRCQ
jgi:hypothetical protein